MNHQIDPKDITGSQLSLGDHCLVTEHNRLIVARVVQVYRTSDQVKLQPIDSSAGHRRSPPAQKPIRRQCYNVYRIADAEITMSILRGAV